jgi:polysaccharide biosynthesis protein PelF
MARAPHRPRVLLTTEGTYPYVMGGVSSWCDLLVRSLDDLDWHVLPIVAPDRRTRLFALPGHARELGPIMVWSDAMPAAWRPTPPRQRRPGRELPGVLVRHLLGWEGDPDAVVQAWLWCRLFPAGVRAAFRSPRGWESFLAGLRDVLDERVPEAGTPPAVDLVEAAALYQTLYWVARTAAVPTPPVDVLHVTAAGWSAIPALVHKALHGTPLVLTEHGVFVREAYLGAAREGGPPGARFTATRLARGLARAAYDGADIVSPVTDANASWEVGLGVDPARIVPLYNGVRPTAEPVLPPGAASVVSVGRVDALKDFHTMLRVAAEAVRHVPQARFLHYGPVAPENAAYGRSCVALHERLGLRERFRWMGPTDDPQGAMRAADVVLMTSISEGLPMSILEAMGQGRPVVSTGVGGVPDVVRGCGVVTPPGDVQGLASAVASLLRAPALARRLGERGHRRLGRIFNEAACVDGYRELLAAAAATRRRLGSEAA